MRTTEEFDNFVQRIAAAVRPPDPPAVLKPQTDGARIALLKIALDQFLLNPHLERVVGRDVWEFAQSVREDC